MKKLLFVCSANISRSPTAAEFFRACPEFDTKSAGTEPYAGGKPVSQDLVDWANIIFALSEKTNGHRTFLKEHFAIPQKTPIYDLDIPNGYLYGEPALQLLLLDRVSKYISLSPKCMQKLDSLVPQRFHR
ncbi:MAG: phosphotyrosine protein phosphatase [Candidatus Lloydbacteria bacterium CG22_combo_CG10-13_8_21_14_all_47_15]|uniref:Phosphotyrosine protein phosphatase n=1 Tax=Candidatus Lloydbacteria bacterium CG22_combo_CG10-13_8_21_14_all_47_15 TaxID=1974635 RepID=A0A2H0CVL2_9BACT|nr:MAG: phosphotyrosine protein phosphatase [Candidatus Lloydbacteria bacterium CG22_combo_CG10-13_8_21_14_all_47_15]